MKKWKPLNLNPNLNLGDLLELRKDLRKVPRKDLRKVPRKDLRNHPRDDRGEDLRECPEPRKVLRKDLRKVLRKQERPADLNLNLGPREREGLPNIRLICSRAH
jgi:hypothetical protein